MNPNVFRRLQRRVTRLARLGGAKPRAASLPDIGESDKRIIQQVAPYTMTSPERRLAMMEAVRHVVSRQIDGDFVECGVWRGGSMLAAILTLQALGVRERRLWLYDTFEGMTAPTGHDTSAFEPPAQNAWTKAKQAGTRAWDHLFREEIFGEQQVRALLQATGYPPEHMDFVRGPVEKTIPGRVPESIALLRLDTDWYESTLHELQHLYPRLRPGGVLIVDDYGHWQGCRKAVDEYFATLGREAPMLIRIDYTARVAIKPG